MKKIKNKQKKIFLFISIAVALVVLIGVYFIFNANDGKYSFSLSDKQWIEKNKQNLIDINIVNQTSIISDNGEGIIFDLLTDFEDETGLEFNKVSYDYLSEKTVEGLSFKVISSTDKYNYNDLLLYEDDYLIISNKNNKLLNKNIINGKNIAILSSDIENVKLAVNNLNVNLKSYSDISTLIDSINNASVDYAIIPNYIYLNGSIKDDVYVNYHLSDISNKIILQLGNNSRLNDIFKKYFYRWKDNRLNDSILSNLSSFYFANKNISDVDKTSLSSKVYKYGYIEQLPYNKVENNKLYGIIGEYLNNLSKIGTIDFEYKKYNSIKELKKALDSKQIDLAFINFPYENNKYINSDYLLFNELAIVGKRYNQVNSKTSLNNKEISVVEGTNIYNDLKKNTTAKIKTISKNTQNIDENQMLILDKEEYLFNYNNKYDNYYLLALDNYDKSYNFVSTKDEEMLMNLLNFVINYSNKNFYHAKALNNLNLSIIDRSSFEMIYICILLLIFIPIILFIIFKALVRYNLKHKTLKKEDILKYTDLLTSLKNRNYLMKNIKTWDEAKTYPKTIIMLDLNKLKYVNDNHGQLEGNKLIEKAAAILINTQLEKSEIIRTDGNEFLIYLLGYSKKQIDTYTIKLQKEFEKLPYGFGAAMGYSIINDEITTIDDAINEATIEMRKNKEKFK